LLSGHPSNSLLKDENYEISTLAKERFVQQQQQQQQHQQQQHGFAFL
jgi:hypothetical protein